MNSITTEAQSISAYGPARSTVEGSPLEAVRQRSAGIVGVSRRRARVVTTQRDKDARSAPDLVDRDTCHPPVRESSVWLDP
jgi:putative transposase